MMKSAMNAVLTVANQSAHRRLHKIPATTIRFLSARPPAKISTFPTQTRRQLKLTTGIPNRISSTIQSEVSCISCHVQRSFCTQSKHSTSKSSNRTDPEKKQATTDAPSKAKSASNSEARKPSSGGTTTSTSSALTKKRAKRKTATEKTVIDEYGYNYDEKQAWPITAYGVCEEFDLTRMHKGLIAQGLYDPTVLNDDLSGVIHVTARYPISKESREIFFFREGAIVFWNMSYLERVNVLKFVKEYGDEIYSEEEVEDECEFMSYTYSNQGSTRLVRDTVFLELDSQNTLLEKYAFANALASSVKLGIWETTLEKYVEGIEDITEALKRAEEIKLTRGEVLQKTGELFALRHQLNLNSDLLDTPDFYWERERLETLYQKTCDYLCVNRRTKVMNEKLAQCCELLELISSHLTDQHHTRLEWMIIVLIMIEVGFEILHLLERYEIVQT